MFHGNHAEILRTGHDGGPPIIARVADGRTHLDLRTIDPAHDTIVADALQGL